MRDRREASLVGPYIAGSICHMGLREEEFWGAHGIGRRVP